MQDWSDIVSWKTFGSVVSARWKVHSDGITWYIVFWTRGEREWDIGLPKR